jgi:hypothetical protein
MADPKGEPSELHGERGLFRAEYERELGQWLRRRLGWLCVAYAVFQLLATASVVVTTVWAEDLLSAQAPAVTAVTTPAPSRTPPLSNTATGAAAADAPTSGARGAAAQDASAQRAQTPLDAVGEIARDIAREVRDAAPRERPAAPPIGRMVDRWWEDAIAPITARGRAEAAREAGPAEHEAGSTANRGMEVAAEQAQTPAVEALPAELRIPWYVWLLLNVPSLVVIAWFGLRVRPKLYTRAELVDAATRMIVTLGFLTFGVETGMLLASPSATAIPLFSIFFWHATASLFLPWSWRESLKPILPILACWVLLRAGLASESGAWVEFVAALIFAPLLFVPALVLCYVRLRWHRNRFKSGFVGRRFVQMRREFLQARAVHESLFPKPIDAGWMRFDFGYRPAADIGGDFIHVWTDERERFHLALIDVTGHGLASAMSVARIHGEIERLRDEYPDEGPARILLRLNRYFHRLLAKHKLYATAVLLMIDPHSGELRYASAGHPPVFVRSRGRVSELSSTTFLLGAVDDSMFGDEEGVVRLEEGDTMVLFTDGAYDARNPRGERFGLERLREIMQRSSAPPSWTQYLMRLVETFEAGMPEDDLLIAEVSFFSRRSLSSITGDDLPMSAEEYAGARA